MYARISALLVAFALAVTSLAAAQERFGNITGKVTDQTGAVLPGVTVTVTNNETQRSTVVVSDSNGTFYATALDPGRYAVKFELSGFITQEAPSVILLLGTTATVDSSLRVGGVTETVQVLAGTPLIDVASTTHQKNIPAEEFEVIPKGRSFQALATALPSVNAGELEGGFQVNGASAGENNFTVDGVSVVSQIHGNQRQDAVFEYLQEVQVKTSGLEAEYGGALGGVISAVTKSGGNTFRGSLYEHYSRELAALAQRSRPASADRSDHAELRGDRSGRRPEVQPQRVRWHHRRSDRQGPSLLLRIGFTAHRESDAELHYQHRRGRAGDSRPHDAEHVRQGHVLAGQPSPVEFFRSVDA